MEKISDTTFKKTVDEADKEKIYNIIALRYEEKRLVSALESVRALITEAENLGIDTNVDTSKPIKLFSTIQND